MLRGFSDADYSKLANIIKTDNTEELASFPCIYDILKLEDVNLFNPAILYKASKCMRWLLQNGADPNCCSNTSSSPLVFACGQNFYYTELVASGARVEISDSAWRNIYHVWRYTTTPNIYFPAIGKLFLLGLRLPKNQPYIPSPCHEAYEVILEREKACRRACYTFLHQSVFPKDLAKWLLQRFVFPSRREECWSALPMPEEFFSFLHQNKKK